MLAKIQLRLGWIFISRNKFSDKLRAVQELRGGPDRLRVHQRSFQRTKGQLLLVSLSLCLSHFLSLTVCLSSRAVQCQTASEYINGAFCLGVSFSLLMLTSVIGN